MLEKISRALKANYCQPAPPASVTTVSPREEPPEAGGLTPAVIDAIWGAVVRYYETGLQPALALCLRRGGRVVLDRAIGHLRGNGPGERLGEGAVLATPDSLYNLFSASKAVTAMVIHLLDDRGLLHLDDAVEEYIPGFGQHGKGGVTIRHVLTHRAGIPAVPGEPVDLDLLTDPEEIVRLLSSARPASVAGRRLAYHAVTGGFVLGEIVQRVTGKSIRQVLQEEVCDPLGFSHFNYGVPEADLPRVAREYFTGPRPRFPLSRLVDNALGVSITEAVEISNDPRFLTAVVPAGNLIATPDEICRFFELLLRGGELDGVRIFDHRTVRRATAEQSYLEVDATLLLPLRYGMGFMLGGEHLSFYGHRSPRAFGHVGFTSVIAWADPERDISVALMSSGNPLVPPEIFRWFDVMWTISRLCPRAEPGLRGLGADRT